MNKPGLRVKANGLRGEIADLRRTACNLKTFDRKIGDLERKNADVLDSRNETLLGLNIIRHEISEARAHFRACELMDALAAHHVELKFSELVLSLAGAIRHN